MREQLEKRIEALGAVLDLRNKTIADCEAALHDAKMNRDRVAGGIVELEYALEQAPIEDDTIKGQIPAGGKT